MIKNILYSLLLHGVLFLIIYANFNLKTFKEEEVQEIAISLTTLSGDGKVNKTVEEVKPEEKPQEEIKKPEIKEEKAPEKAEKKEIKKKEQKQEKAPPKKEIAKPKFIEKAKPVKPVEKVEEKKPVVEKPKEDKIINKEKEEITDNKKKDEVVKDLRKTVETKEKQPVQNAVKSTVEEVANTIENLNLSPRQKLNIRSQLGRCYKKATDDMKPKNKIVVQIKISVDQEGYIKSNLDEIIDRIKYNIPEEKDYRITIDNVRRALEFCSPLRNLPLDRMDVLKEVVLEFDENKIVEN